MKKLLSFILALTTISMVLCLPAFATSESSVENEGRVVESIYDNNKLVTTFDEYFVTMERYSLDTGDLIISVRWERDSDYITVTQDGETKTMLAADAAASVRSSTPQVGTKSNSLSNSTTMGYEYTITYGSTYYWSLHCPEYDDGGETVYSFTCAERDSYYDKLESFRVDVDNIAALEQKIQARTSAKILNAALAVAFVATGTPEGFAFAFSAWFADQGYSIEIQDFAADIGVYQKDAYDKYWRVQREWSELAKFEPEVDVM